MGIYADPQLLEWFISEYPTYSNSKLDMGKSYIRFKEMDDIPYILLGQLASKISVDEWISIYENKLKS